MALAEHALHGVEHERVHHELAAGRRARDQPAGAPRAAAARSRRARRRRVEHGASSARTLRPSRRARRAARRSRSRRAERRGDLGGGSGSSEALDRHAETIRGTGSTNQLAARQPGRSQEINELPLPPSRLVSASMSGSISRDRPHPQLALQHLAGGVARQLRDELELLGELLRGEAARAQERDQLGEGRAGRRGRRARRRRRRARRARRRGGPITATSRTFGWAESRSSISLALSVLALADDHVLQAPGDRRRSRRRRARPRSPVRKKPSSSKASASRRAST